MSSKSKSKPSAFESMQQPALFILQYKTRRVLVGSPKDYDQLQLSIRRHFPEIPADHRVSYHTDELAISKGALVEVSEDIWDTVIPLLSTLMVQTEPRQSTSRSAVGETGREWYSSCGEENDPKPPARKPRQGKDTNLTLEICTIDGQRCKLQCSAFTTVNAILSEAIERLELDRTLSCRAIYEGRQLPVESNDILDWNSPSIQELNIKDGGTIHLVPRLIGGKPVIYLFPPSGTEIDASVKLSLVPEWHFSAIYPVVPITSYASDSGSARQTLRWDVKASSDGTLFEKNAGLDVTYLFWEAKTFGVPSKEGSPRTPSAYAAPSSPNDHDGEAVAPTFTPNQARVEPSNSIVLEVAKLTPYLYSMLKALGLHVEARTSFITYWLPSFLKHTHIALRFLPQRAYERAAPLEVEPKPDVTVRVFMLFKGLKQDQLQNEGSDWCEASESDAQRWKRVVGVDERRSLADGTLFRVVEWGGMEVFS